ncbi:hypothetical protein GCM10027036_08520 [Flavihumibacter cheonanensis]|uniref:hypothetical protein n=1 Tax=Flavihumibacter cheonanensis TaxID=1442385 RepID=UPI001EF7ECC4|nr:hypothetical protein [Flavihumibacter cheonanensis]MCG7751708.1 hypothetical protein [Flavihumibacter cheonanensis]
MRSQLIYVLLLYSCFAKAQQNRFTLGLGHTHVSQGKIDNDTKWLALASWSLNYDYWINSKWAIGLQNDIILESFVINNSKNKEIERNYPWAIVPVVLYKPGKHFSFLAGIGTETSHGHTSLWLTRLGIEYGYHLPKNWELGAACVWDNKWNNYNSWGLALTVSKILSRNTSH